MCAWMRWCFFGELGPELVSFVCNLSQLLRLSVSLHILTCLALRRAVRNLRLPLSDVFGVTPSCQKLFVDPL